MRIWVGWNFRKGHVYYKPPVKHSAAPGIYKIVGTLPVESEGRLAYRIKSAAETFERTADESELTLPQRAYNPARPQHHDQASQNQCNGA